MTSADMVSNKLIRMKDKSTGKPMFSILSVVLACDKCRDEGKATECIHLLHLVPRWQSGVRHTRLKTIMQVIEGAFVWLLGNGVYSYIPFM
jgi:hypothetical protein